jgi:hypothetical protein
VDAPTSGWWIFRTADLVVRRNRGGVVLLLVTLRITCACGRGPPRHVCAAAGPVVPVVDPLRAPRIPDLTCVRPRAWRAGSAVGQERCCVLREAASCCGARTGVVSADSCGPGARVGGIRGQ